MSKRFNIRVYGLIINDKNELLLTDEIRYGKEITKFPGGGMHWGEGPVDCIRRECMEEIGFLPVSVTHFYTTDFFQLSAFNEDDQIVSIYYFLQLPETDKIRVVSEKFLFADKLEGAQVFRWKKIEALTEGDVTFPIDKKVVLKLIQEMRPAGI